MKKLLIAVLVSLILLQSSAAADTVNFTVLHTNDEHSAIIPYSPAIDFSESAKDPTIGGFARLSTLVKSIRAERSEEVILISAGDFTGGSPFSWLVTEGESPEIALMQKIGYNVITLGNHEFDYGAEKLVVSLLNAGYPKANEKTAIVSTNLVAPAGHPINGIVKKYFVLELENLKLGFIGLLGKDAKTKAYSYEPLDFEDPIKSAKQAVEDLKKEGVDLIIAVTHSGVSEDLKLAEAVPEIDIIVGGHSHTVIEEPVITSDGTVIVQAGDGLKYIGVLELSYDRDSGKLKIRNYETGTPFLIEINDEIPIDPEINAAISDYIKKVNAMIYNKTGRNISDPIASADFALTTRTFQESNIGNFITDAMRLVVEEKTGKRVDFAVFANGEIRGNITPGTMEYSKGKISLYDLLLPVSLGVGDDGSPGYSLVSFYITGEEVYRVLEITILLHQHYGDDYFVQFSGLRYYYNPQNAFIEIPFVDKKIPSAMLPNLGSVVKAERYKGTGKQTLNEEDYEVIERDGRLYRVVTDSYILSFLPKIAEVLPQLTVVPKDERGNPIPPDDYKNLVLKVNGEELKVWQVVVEYTLSQPVDEEGLPHIDDYYQKPTGRINVVWSFPIAGYPLAAIIAIVAVVLYFKVVRGRK
uniref:Bifunctional metallophosphatase/5'-nucleotidase n=1 Tax=Archaeoglobus fulgidus TaxID=2234 RepID=A0A7C3RDY4_ARCFL